MARAEVMPAEQAAALADFARNTKAAARTVTLYPSTHPAIQGALARVVAAAARLTAAGPMTLSIEPDAIAIDGAAPARADVAIRELAELLHERLIGSLRIEREADAPDWLALLLLLGRATDDLIADGGIGKVWHATGRGHFEIREIDYAAVLRERAGGEGAEWNRIIAHCLQGDASTLDERTIAAMVDTFGDSDRLRAFLDTLQTTAPEAGGVSAGARAAALLHLLRRALDLSSAQDSERSEHLLQTVADSAARLTPEMMLALIGEGRASGGAQKDAVDAVVARMGDGAIASFVANSVVGERGATSRLAQAFQALVPVPERKERLLELARADAEDSPIGNEDGFQSLWQSAASMLTSYTDSTFVSLDYGRELSGARSQAIEVDRVSDDPPERVQAWLSTVEDAAIQQLDLRLLDDLLRLEQDPVEWQMVAAAAVSEIERRTLLGRIDDALQLAAPIRHDAGLIDKLATGPLVRNIAVYLRRAEESDAEPLNRLCHIVGPGVARPLAEALAVEDNTRTIRRLRELLLSFGAAGRQSVEQLKGSINPAVRRMAIDLLRVFGGSEALPELASMLDDDDPQVQRESIRAIVQIATDDAYAVLERVLVAGSASRDTVLRELIDLRDDKAIPLLCYVLNHSTPRRGLVDMHTRIIDALGNLSEHDESTRTLRAALHRGQWWAPVRTAALRRAAATALRRIGAPETLTVLENAAATGSRGVRSAARDQLDAGARRERTRL